VQRTFLLLVTAGTGAAGTATLATSAVSSSCPAVPTASRADSMARAPAPGAATSADASADVWPAAGWALSRLAGCSNSSSSLSGSSSATLLVRFSAACSRLLHECCLQQASADVFPDLWIVRVAHALSHAHACTDCMSAASAYTELTLEVVASWVCLPAPFSRDTRPCCLASLTACCTATCNAAAAAASSAFFEGLHTRPFFAHCTLCARCGTFHRL
jgi:hypothetical protein